MPNNYTDTQWEVEALPKVYFFHLSFFVFLSLTLLHLAVAYSLEADADRRKSGFISRASFSDDSEPSPNVRYMSNGTITMNAQGMKECVKRRLVIQVVTLS